MRLSTIVDYSQDPQAVADAVAVFEQAGVDIVWVPEVYTFDAPSLLGFLAARTTTIQLGSGILPIYSRTPALLAMTAAGVDALSDGRCILGLGASGPQVIEGWHGVAYDRPLVRTREIIEICRQVWERSAPLVHDGAVYQIPLPPERGTGLGKPLRIINRPRRSRIPIWLAALGERNVTLAAELAEGWLPVFFIPERASEVFGRSHAAGLGRRDQDRAPRAPAARSQEASSEVPHAGY